MRIRKEWNDILRALRLDGSFVQNSAWMFTSSGVSILIQVIFFPILSRIYSPEVYGLFGVFNFYSTTLGNAMTLGYNQAYVLPADRREFSALLHLTIRASVGFALATTFIVLLAGEPLLLLAGHDDLGNWAYLIAPVALLMAWDRMTSDWAIRNGEFRRQTVVSTTITLLTKAFNAGYGFWIHAGPAGLILTTLLQHGLRAWAYLQWVIKDSSARLTERIRWQEIKRVARLYKEFPLFIYWGNVLSIFSAALPAALLPLVGFDLAAVGFYGYSIIILDLPIRLLGSGVASVFQQKSAELVRNRPHELKRHALKLMGGLTLLALPFTVLIWMLGEESYSILFGSQWVVAGAAAECLVWYYLFRMISSPLTVLYTTLRKEKNLFLFQVILTVLRICALVGGAYLTNDFIELMILFSAVNAVAYALLCADIWRMVGHFDRNLTVHNR